MGGAMKKIVIAGHSGLLCADYVNLSVLPAIHLSSKESFPKELDPRVKPGGDGLEAETSP
jgi:hypothetical protein